MNVLIALDFLLQAVETPVAGGTPIPDGTLVVSESGVQFPALPEDAAPRPINEDWELLYYEVSAGSREYFIRGEIRNTSPNPLETPTLSVTVAGVAQVGIHPDVNQVGPGERAPFQYNVSDDEITAALNKAQDVEFTGVCEGYRVVPKLEFAWDFQNIEIEFDARREAVRVEGTVKNAGDATAERYAPMLFGFTANGRYLGSIAAREVPDTIFGGDEFRFEMNHGFDSYYSKDPFQGAGRGALFVLAMSTPVYASLNCVG